jgi:hypothetical protein
VRQKINIMKIIYSDTWEELTLKMLGYYHDHCWHHYVGNIDNMPEKFNYLLTENKKFVFIFEEANPTL